MTLVALTHRTTYRYSAPAGLGPQRVRLHPAPHARACIEDYALTIGPMAHDLTWQRDPFGNRIARLTTYALPDEWWIEVALTARLDPVNPFGFVIDPQAARFPFTYEAGEASDLAPFLATLDGGERFEALAARFAGTSQDTVDLLVALNAAVRAEVGYVKRLEPGTQTPEQTLATHAGSCRDSAWALVQLLRRLGIAARFVSGYSVQLADGAEIAEDGVDLHAWAEAFIPGAGWIGLDPVSGLLTAEGHIPLAATARLEAAAPVEGSIYGDVTATIDFTVEVGRLA